RAPSPVATMRARRSHQPASRTSTTDRRECTTLIKPMCKHTTSYIYKHTHTHTHTTHRIHTHTHTPTHTHTHTHTHTTHRIHTHTHTPPHTYTHTHINSYIHTLKCDAVSFSEN